jgi:hypothetical protein
MFTRVFDTVLEFAMLGLFLGVCGYAARLVLTTARGDHLRPGANNPEHVNAPAPREEAPGHD